MRSLTIGYLPNRKYRMVIIESQTEYSTPNIILEKLFDTLEELKNGVRIITKRVMIDGYILICGDFKKMKVILEGFDFKEDYPVMLKELLELKLQYLLKRNPILIN